MNGFMMFVTDEDREAAAWVREHGGLDHVKSEWRSRVPHDRYERRRQRLLGHIAECETALGRRREIISELGHRASDLTRENAELRKRAMPEGMCWPVFEDGEPVRIGDVVSDVEVRSVVFRDGGILLSDCTSVPGWGTWRSYKEPIKRPAPEVLDADGAEIRVGDTVYEVKTGDKFVVETLYSGTTEPDFPDHTVRCHKPGDITAHMFKPSQLTHRAPVLAADGRPLREGETVWDENGDELVVGALEDGGHTVTCRYADVGDGIPVHGMWSPSDLTHERPVADTWERLEEDCAKSDVDYCAERGLLDPSCDTVEGEGSTRHCTDCGCTCGEKMARDIVRRAKVLAGVSE